MNDIDSAIKAEFAELVLGRPIVLAQEGIDRWARWITKIFLSYQTAYPDPLARPEDYTSFKATLSPLPGTQIYLTLGVDLPWPHLHTRRLMMASDPFDRTTQAPAMQVWTAIYGQLVVQVIHDLGLVPVPIREDDPSRVRLWPDPPARVDHGSLSQLNLEGVAELSKLGPLFDAGSEESTVEGN